MTTICRTLSLFVFAVGAAAAAAGCAVSRPVPADVRVPPELLRGSPYTASGESPRTRYVVRMTDGQRDWEIQLPEIATAYEVKVPLAGKAAQARDPTRSRHVHPDRGGSRNPTGSRGNGARGLGRSRAARQERRRRA